MAGTSRDVFARMTKGVTVNTGEPVLQVRRGTDGRYSIGLRHDSKLYDKPGNPHENPNDRFQELRCSADLSHDRAGRVGAVGVRPRGLWLRCNARTRGDGRRRRLACTATPLA